MLTEASVVHQEPADRTNHVDLLKVPKCQSDSDEDQIDAASNSLMIIRQRE